MEVKHNYMYREVVAICIAIIFVFPVFADAQTYGSGTYGGGNYSEGVVSNDGESGGSGSRSGSRSVESRIQFLIANGNVEEADALMKEWPQLFPNQIATEAPQATPSSSVTPLFTRDLEQNMTGEDVRNLQKFLNANGFIVSAAGAGSVGLETNLFGPATKAALIRYQTANGIVPAVGYLGPITRALVNAGGGSSESASQPTTQTPVASSQIFAKVLLMGMTDPDVVELQRVLNSDPDTRIAPSGVGSPGNETQYFGVLTLDAVQRFQIKHNIATSDDPAFGRVGPKTREKLNSFRQSE